ncbi:MAG: type IX secretion system membrane protein PorP/SprF [Marinifilum sp.]|jgi:type IX secretion system PorP/SprF family membrane protein|nr:type IX secretion system membrane protein PorP/SprF [Marinifilum sp.]
MIKWRIVHIIILFVFSHFVKAQDIEFSQFYANRLYLNPALAGSEFAPVASVSYRNQWPQNNKAFVTYSASFDQYVDIIHGGLGLLIMQDNQGDGAIKTTMASGMYSYSLNINRNLSINTGLKVTYVQRKLDWESLVFSDMIDPLYGVIYPGREVQPGSLSHSYLDFSLGIVANYKNFYLGAVADHLSEPDEAFDNDDNTAILPRKYTVHAGALIPIGYSRGLMKSDYSISPNILYQKQQNFEQINYGLYFSRTNWVVGTWFRQNLSFDFDAFIVLLGYQTDRLRIGYSYDYVVSKLVKTNSGAHEISLTYLLGKTRTSCSGSHYFKKKRRIRAIRCPKF